MLKLFWYCLDMSEEDQNFVVESLDELKQLLKRPSVEVELKVFPLAQDVVPGVRAELSKPLQKTKDPFSAYYFAIRRKNVPRDKCTPLMVYCKPSAGIVKAAKKQAKERNGVSPRWGYMADDVLSAVYERCNKYILWHEILHLFQVDDCYPLDDPYAGPTCELPNCIMQYEPLKETVGEWPFLCEKNIKRIQACSEKRTHN